MRWLDGVTDSTDMSLSKLPEVGDGQESLACCSPWGDKKSDMTEWLNWIELKQILHLKYDLFLTGYSEQFIKWRTSSEILKVLAKPSLSTSVQFSSVAQ